MRARAQSACIRMLLFCVCVNATRHVLSREMPCEAVTCRNPPGCASVCVHVTACKHHYMMLSVGLSAVGSPQTRQHGLGLDWGKPPIYSCLHSDIPGGLLPCWASAPSPPRAASPDATQRYQILHLPVRRCGAASPHAHVRWMGNHPGTTGAWPTIRPLSGSISARFHSIRIILVVFVECTQFSMLLSLKFWSTRASPTGC